MVPVFVMLSVYLTALSTAKVIQRQR